MLMHKHPRLERRQPDFGKVAQKQLGEVMGNQNASALGGRTVAASS